MSEQPQVNLNITDISDAIKVLDYAAEQGAYRGWANIRQVIALRDRLDAFVTAAGAHIAPPEGPQAEGPQAEPQAPQVKE
jgi:hypothetical protein